MASLHQTLSACNLNDSDIVIYLLLSKKGEIDVTRIITQSQLSRATVYDSLRILEQYSLVERRKEGRSVYYRLAHPQNLMNLAEQRQQEIEMVSHDMRKHVEDMTGIYNLLIGKPGVRFFEGEEGLKEALYDSLDARGTIYTYANEEIIQKHIKHIDTAYISERIRRGILKKLILADTPAAHTIDHETQNEFTKVKLFPQDKKPFDISMEIYDDTISYLTIHENNPIAFLITHPGIAQHQKLLFELVWNQL